MVKVNRKVQIWLGMLAVYIFWGSTYLAIHFAVETMPPFLMAGVRFVIAGLILYIWRRLAGDPAPTLRQWRSATIIGVFLMMLGNGALVWAEQRVASGIASLFVGSAPLWMVMFDAVRPQGQRRVNWQTVAGALVGFGGIVLLVDPFHLEGAGQHLDVLGVIGLLLSAMFWAMGSLYSRDAHLPKSPLMGTGMELLTGGAGLLLMGSVAGEWANVHPAQISAASWWGLAYLITFGSLVGFASYTWLLRVAPTPLVATYAYVNPLIAIALGSLLAGEAVTLRVILATAVILSSVALINFARNLPERHKTAPETVYSESQD